MASRVVWPVEKGAVGGGVRQALGEPPIRQREHVVIRNDDELPGEWQLIRTDNNTLSCHNISHKLPFHPIPNGYPVTQTPL